ncbi:MAG: phage tail protein [Bacteroidota bacterium]
MDEYMAIVKLFAGNFAPKNWAFCNGQLLPVNQYQALFSLLGTTYGGDGITTFGLPDLRNRVPIGAGSYQSMYVQVGEKQGTPTSSLNISQMGAHNHMEAVSTLDSATDIPTTGAVMATPIDDKGAKNLGYGTVAPQVTLNTATLGMTGGNQPHNNVQPSIGLSYIICLYGLYPPRP